MDIIRARGSPERDISSLGAVRQGPGTFRELFAWRVHLFGDERSIYLKRSDTFWRGSSIWLERNNTFWGKVVSGLSETILCSGKVAFGGSKAILWGKVVLGFSETMRFKEKQHLVEANDTFYWKSNSLGISLDFHRKHIFRPAAGGRILKEHRTLI